MKSFLIPFVSGFLMLAVSCAQSGGADPAGDGKTTTRNTSSKAADQTYTVHADSLLQDFTTWYKYTYRQIHLAQDFTGLDTDSTRLEKGAFLERLMTGEFVPFKTMTQAGRPVYRLFATGKAEPNIGRAMKRLAATEQNHYSREGKPLPDYRFTDLQGQVYSPASTKGNILVIKCWFIRCVACIKEFPELNRLVDHYSARKDIRFISLATDPKADLLTFLEKKPFRYAVIPDVEPYLSNQLQVTAYPMHILVDKEGKVVKVTNTLDDLMPALEKLAGS